MKRDLKGNRFANLDDVEAAVDEQITLIPSRDFHECSTPRSFKAFRAGEQNVSCTKEQTLCGTDVLRSANGFSKF